MKEYLCEWVDGSSLIVTADSPQNAITQLTKSFQSKGLDKMTEVVFYLDSPSSGTTRMVRGKEWKLKN